MRWRRAGQVDDRSKRSFPRPRSARSCSRSRRLSRFRAISGCGGRSSSARWADLTPTPTKFNTHNTLYPQLSPALAAFYDATQELGVAQNVTTFTESDFSRTFQPTTGDGSDHAWGSHHLVMGGAVQGGQIFGKFPTFELGGPDDTDVRGRWIPTTSIDQYGATLCSWFGIPDSALATVFPNFGNFNSQKLGFLG